MFASRRKHSSDLSINLFILSYKLISLYLQNVPKESPWLHQRLSTFCPSAIFPFLETGDIHSGPDLDSILFDSKYRSLHYAGQPMQRGFWGLDVVACL